MDHFSLQKYEVQDAGDNNIVVLVTGSRVYKQVLSRAFPRHFMSRTFDDRYMRFEWGTYIYNVDEQTKNEVVALLETCVRHVFLDDDLTECFALNYHTVLELSGGYKRTNIGSLVYQAKPYGRKPTPRNFRASEALSQQMITFIENHPSYKHSNVIVAAPPSRRDKPFDLPTTLVRNILDRYGTMTDGTRWLIKTRQTQPMKDCRTIPAKINNVRNAFTVSEGADFSNKTVLLVDDIYESGFTMNELGQVLFTAGAKCVLGLVGTKTGRDM